MAEIGQSASHVVLLPPWEPWIPSVDDFWDAYQRIKANYSMGIIKGTNQTLTDTWDFVSTWRIWRTQSALKWLLFVVSLGFICLRRLDVIYQTFYSYMPPWVAQRLDILKIPVYLRKGEDKLEDIIENLDNELGHRIAQAQAEPPQEADRVRSWIPALPSRVDLWQGCQKVRANITEQGLIEGCKTSVADIFSILASWKFWQSNYGRVLIRLVLTFAEFLVLKIKSLYDWVDSKVPKVNVDQTLTDLANYIHDLRRRIAPLNPENGHAIAPVVEDTVPAVMEDTEDEEEKELNDTKDTDDELTMETPMH